MTDHRQLRIRISETLVRKAKHALGDDVSDTIVVRYALALLAEEDPEQWAVHNRPGPPKRRSGITPAA